MTDGIIAFNNEGKIIHINHAAKTFLDEFKKEEYPRKNKRIIILSAICYRDFNLEKIFETIIETVLKKYREKFPKDATANDTKAE